MHTDNQRQLEINMDNVARWAGFRPQEDVILRCEKCNRPLRSNDPEDSELCAECIPEGGDYEETD